MKYLGIQAMNHLQDFRSLFAVIFFQLPPLKGLPVYSSGASIKCFIALDLWRKFQMVELTEIIRQGGNFEFIILSNKIREGDIDGHVENTLKSCFLEEKSFLQHVVHMFAEKNQQKNIMKLN